MHLGWLLLLKRVQLPTPLGQRDPDEFGASPCRVWEMRSTLVGRQDELRLARSALESHGVVVISGPSGVGKTALCDVLSAEWSDRGGHVRELRGIQGLKHVPFGALTLSLRVDPAESGSETLSRVFEAITAGEGRPLVVADDAHLLDDESAAVVSALAQNAEVALALAITSGEVVSPDITSVWARWAEARLQVNPLTEGEVGDLLEVHLGRALPADKVSEIAAISLGYPLYVGAIAAELTSQDTDLGGVLALGTGSDRLTSLMERRLARLNREERRLFDTVAFVESAFAATVLAGEDPIALQGLDQAGLVRLTGARVQVSHPLLGSVARATLTPEGRRVCVRGLLEGLSATSDPGDVAVIVRKALDNGVVPSANCVRTAAAVALSWREYEGLSRLISLYPDDPGLLVLRAQAARFLGEPSVPEIPLGLDDTALTEYLSGTAQGMAYAERRFTDAINYLADAIAMVVDPANRDRLALDLLVLSGLVGDMDALLSAARSVSPTADPNMRLLAISATQLAEALTLSTGSADATYARGLEVASSDAVDPILYEQLEMSRVMVDLAEGRLGDARARQRAFANKTLTGSWLTIEAVLADAWLPLSGAAALATSAVEALAKFDPLANLAQATIIRDLRLAQQGQTPSAEGVSLAREDGVVQIDRIMSERVDAWVAWAQTDPTAGKRLIGVGREAIAMGHRFWGLSALIDAIRLGQGDAVVGDIEHLIITRGAGLAVLAGRHARARSSSELLEVARLWWEAGAAVYAIEAAIRAASEEDPPAEAVVQLLAYQGADPVVGAVSDVGRPFTGRQLEVVTSVLAGSTNDDIADALYLSTRTVENHLYRVYKTLGIKGGRAELVNRLGWIGEVE